MCISVTASMKWPLYRGRSDTYRNCLYIPQTNHLSSFITSTSRLGMLLYPYMALLPYSYHVYRDTIIVKHFGMM